MKNMRTISTIYIIKLTILGILSILHLSFLKITFKIIDNTTMDIDILFIILLTSKADTIASGLALGFTSTSSK